MGLGCLTGCLELQMAEACSKGEMESPMESPMGLENLNGCLESQVAQVRLKSVMGSRMGSTEPN